MSNLCWFCTIRADVLSPTYLDGLVTDLDKRGIKHVYPDGGRLIQSFIHAGRVDAFIISVAPVLIDAGHCLFGELTQDVPLRLDSATTVGGFAQLRYTVGQKRRIRAGRRCSARTGGWLRQPPQPARSSSRSA